MTIPTNLDFDSLRDLHESVNRSLHSPQAKLEIISHGRRNQAHDLSEATLKVADSCAAAKDLLLVARDHLQSLQSAFRRTGGDDHGRQLAPHRLPRKQLKKAILKRLDSLKSARVAGSGDATEDRSLAAVVDLLEEVRSTTLAAVRSLLSLIALPDRDPGRRDPFFRVRLTRVDSLRVWERCEAAEMRAAAKRLEEVEAVVEDMEAELELMFRRLISTRASLLNILTT